MHITWITSESVTEGHPDKICDQVSDAVLDELLSNDPESHVAVETLATDGLIVLAGEVTSSAKVDYGKIARRVLQRIGYTDKMLGMDAKTVAIKLAIHEQSPDIAQGVNQSATHEQGAGDQGVMYGYACDETPELLPLPIALAHKLTLRLAELRKNQKIPYLGPDGKSQVTIEYHNGKPARASAIVLSAQHAGHIAIDVVRKDLLQKVIRPVCGKWMDENTSLYINPTGRFVIGGPAGDTGVTGRKIMVDTYGGVGHHGGGAFSGKDPSKVDRSAAYAARWIAKNIVAAKLARRCEVQISYAIGVAQPVSINIDTFGTGKLPDDAVVRLVRERFDLRPRAIIDALQLKRPIYETTAAYGHFGRNDPGLLWEKTSPALLAARGNSVASAATSKIARSASGRRGSRKSR